MAQVYVSTRIVVADIVGESNALDKVADDILLRAKKNAAQHRLTGDYMDHLHVEVAGRGKDRLVVADGEGAIPIEFGHVIYKKSGGRRVSTGGYVVKRVPGLNIMRDTYAEIPRG